MKTFINLKLLFKSSGVMCFAKKYCSSINYCLLNSTNAFSLDVEGLLFNLRAN